MQAVVKQSLKLESSRLGLNRRAVGPFVDGKINFEYSEKSTNEPNVNFNQDVFLKDLCSRTQSKSGLSNEHSNDFRSLVNSFESLSADELLAAHKKAEAQCQLAG